MKYDNSRDAALYLNGSYVQWRKDVVYVNDVRGDMQADCLVISTGEDRIIPVAKLNLIPVKLGYVYDEELKKAFYIERQPQRAWRQGLTTTNVRAKNSHRFRMTRPQHPLTKAIFDDKYPSLTRARTRAKKERTEIPFNRMFSIDNDLVLRYKTQVVGEWADKEFVLMGKYTYLKELLEEISGENTRCN